MNSYMKSPDVESFRKELGLTGLEAHAYETLLIVGPMTAKDLAVGLDNVPSGVYRLLNSLISRGFAYTMKRHPKIYAAVPMAQILPKLAKDRQVVQMRLQSTLLGFERPANRPPIVSMLHGKQALYERYIDEAERARAEILVFSIGIAYSDRLHATQQLARERGVEIKHVVQLIMPDNYHIVTKWQRLGVKVRHHPAPLGFHLMVFDGRTVIVSFSNPDDTEERTSLILNNPGAAAAMRDYFYGLWAESRLLSY